MTPVKEGKVRQVYDCGDALAIVTTDRISAFDRILTTEIPGKGAVLTQMSRFWFQFTSDLVPNHLITVDTREMGPDFADPYYKDRTMKCRKLTMLPVECIVRGYLTGSGWESYKKEGAVCGIALPEGLSECEKLPEPIFTPTTKAELGEHDANVSFEETVDLLEKDFPGRGKELAEAVRDTSLALYQKCADYAAGRGILIADTKFEFGLDEDGVLTLGDECLTPDSSRFWPAEGYEVGHGQPSFDKQYVRDHLKAHPGSDALSPEVVERTIGKYREAFRLLTGEELS